MSRIYRDLSLPDTRWQRFLLEPVVVAAFEQYAFVRRTLVRLLMLVYLFAAFFLTANVAPGAEVRDDLPWSEAIGNAQGILSIESHAAVSVSDGVEYEVLTAWRGNQRSIFHRIYADRSVTMGHEGLLNWSWDGESQTTLAPALAEVIAGHQFHARLLFLDGIDRSNAVSIASDEFCECEGYRVTPGDGGTLTMYYQGASRQPRALVMDSADFGQIVIRYHDWRTVDVVSLPWGITVDHDGRQFDYRFNSIALNERELWDRLHPPIDKLTPEQQLLAMHRLSIDAHIESDVSLLAGRWADNVVNVYGGEASSVPGSQMAQFLGRSLANRRHSIYRDMIRPIVNLSADGTMGSITAQIEAAGVRLEYGKPTGESFAFQSAWLATYHKRDGTWRMTAIASGVEYEN